MDIINKARELARLQEPMAMRKEEGVRYFYFPRLKDLGLDHYFSSVDVNMKLGSRHEDVELTKDWTNLLNLLPKAKSEYYFMYQNHSDFSVIVDEEGLGEKVGLGRRLAEPDGLITSRTDFVLSSSYADCAPLLFFDPVARVQANVHSGWRGSLANIAGNTFALINESYELDPRNMHLAIGPHIGRDDFEVDLDVAEMFAEKYPDLVPYLIREKARPAGYQGPQKYLIDLNFCIIYNLLKAGLPAENIISANRSTVSHPGDYHSYRRDKDKFGLMMVVSQIH